MRCIRSVRIMSRSCFPPLQQVGRPQTHLGTFCRNRATWTSEDVLTNSGIEPQDRVLRVPQQTWHPGYTSQETLPFSCVKLSLLSAKLDSTALYVPTTAGDISQKQLYVSDYSTKIRFPVDLGSAIFLAPCSSSWISGYAGLSSGRSLSPTCRWSF